MNKSDREKTAFCPGPGMGLYQFCRMPFGLTGAPSSYQCLMDTVLRGLPSSSCLCTQTISPILAGTSRWKAFYAVVPWPFKSMILLSVTRKGMTTATQMLFAHVQLPSSRSRKHWACTTSRQNHFYPSGLTKTSKHPSGRLWNKYPLKHYKQLWNQLRVQNGVLC